MKNLFVESAKMDVAASAMMGIVVAESKMHDEDGKAFYLTLVEVDGYPNIYQTEESIFEQQMNPEEQDEEWFKEINTNNAVFMGEYEELFELEDDMLDGYRYLTFIIRADWEEASEYIETTTGNWLADIEIPVSDIEEELMWESEDEDQADKEE